jgi:hypothetical protein
MIRNSRLIAMAIAVIFLGEPWSGMANATTEAPRGAGLMSAAELYKLYRGKTWVWSNGAGFFAKDGRFSAWSGTGDEAVYATGGWWVNFLGGVCIDAAWHTRERAHVDVTCFDHSKDRNVLYQRRELSGDWYVFRSVPRKLDDEFEKLKDGDLVEAEIEKIKSKMNPTSE